MPRSTPPLLRRAAPLLLVVSLLAPAVRAQQLARGARGIALAGATTALSGDAWNGRNAASTAALPRATLGFTAARPYGLSSLRLATAGMSLPTQAGTLSAGLRSFGNDSYGEVEVSGGYARAFRLGTWRTLLAGVELRYVRVAITGYGAAGVPVLSGGWITHLAPGLSAGFHGSALATRTFGGGERLPRVLCLGLAYQPSGSVLLLADVAREPHRPTSVRLAAEFVPVAGLALRGGLTTRPARLTAGVGLHFRVVGVDLAVERHALLGLSPLVTLSLQKPS